MFHKPEIIADYILLNAGMEINAIKLNCLMYIAQGHFLAILETPLLDTVIIASKFGPVIPKTILHFENLKEPVEKLIHCDSPLNGNLEKERQYIESEIKPETKLLLRKILDEHQQLTDKEIIDSVKKRDTPWFRLHKPGRNDIEITNDDLKKYYKKELKLP